MNDGNQVTKISVMDADTLNVEVVEIVLCFTQSESLFTAFDVTKRIRFKNPTMKVPHYGVKEMVLELFNSDFSDEYDRECIDLTVGQKAFVYYPQGGSASSYALAVQTAPDNSSGTDGNTDSDLTVEKRLNVSRFYLDKMNLTAGKLVNVTMDNNIMSLTATTDPSGKTLVVNSDGRLRINKKMLTEQFGYLPTKFDIQYSPDNLAIEITPK